MTNSDLERELEGLLPCQYGCCETTPPRECDNCTARPAILAWVQRKLDEAKAEGANEERSLHWQEIVGHADSELLEKVETLATGTAYLNIAKWPSAVYVTRYAYDEHQQETQDAYDAPTLVEALRKLVGGESCR